MSSPSSITAMFAADRHRELVERAEVSRIARSVRRRRSAWAWLRRGRGLAPQPALAPASTPPDLAPARPQPDLAATLPLPDLVTAPPERGPASTLPLPALSGAGADAGRAGRAG
jgi:hypothetical protein